MSKKLVEKHIELLNKFDDISTATNEERQQCLADRRFATIRGAQWEDDLGKQFQGRPKFEINKLELSAIRIFNEYRANRFDVKFLPKDGKKEQDDGMANICTSRYRTDKEDTCGEESYDNAFDEAVLGGIGAWRLYACNEDNSKYNNYQRIAFQPIYDADSSVYFDLSSNRQDKSDANFCFVLSSIQRSAYIEKYGESPSSWPKSVTFTRFDWSAPDLVYIAEYYELEPYEETFYEWTDLAGDTSYYSEDDYLEDPQLEEMLIASGQMQTGEKIIEKNRVHKYLMSGEKIIEDCGYVPGEHIPIIMNYGKRSVVDNVERCKGHIRNAKDAQRLKNMQTSALAEISAMSPIEKPILSPAQVAGHEYRWASDNVKNWPYMLLNPISDGNGNDIPSGPAAFTKSPVIPPALAALIQLSDADIETLLGNQDRAEELKANISGHAIELVQSKIDMQSYIYIDNMRKAIQRCGEIWLSMAKELYVENDRELKIMDKDKEVDSVTLYTDAIDKQTGKTYKKNDFKKADYDLRVTVGEATKSRKNATARMLISIMTLTQNPEDQNIILSMIMQNLDGEGIDEIRKFYRKRLIMLGVLEPTESEREELMQEMSGKQQSNAEQDYLRAAALEAMSKAKKAEAETMLTVAKTDETKAKTAETIAGMGQNAQRHTLENIERLENMKTATMEPDESMRRQGTMPPESMRERERI